MKILIIAKEGVDNLQEILSIFIRNFVMKIRFSKSIILLTLLIPMTVLASDNIIEVTITAYTPTYKECDNDPHITSSNRRVRFGYVALSRDLEKKLGLKFGDMILIPFEFQDRMNKKWKNRIDIFMHSEKSAKKFGKRKTRVFVIKKDHWEYLKGGEK